MSQTRRCAMGGATGYEESVVMIVMYRQLQTGVQGITNSLCVSPLLQVEAAFIDIKLRRGSCWLSWAISLSGIVFRNSVLTCSLFSSSSVLSTCVFCILSANYH